MAKKKIVKATYVMFLYEDDDAEVMLPNGKFATVMDHEECEITAANVDDAVFRITRGKKIFLHSGSDIEYAREYGGDDDATTAQRKRWKLEVHPTISFW
jgi:hypothetical protein